jgi:DNA repair protein RecO (recombination protein O)
MNAVVCRAIVLSRTNFGEADRIVTALTPDAGKLKLMVKGVRKQGSKLAGGVELFSVSELSFIPGKRDIGTLVSSRIDKHFGEIVKDVERTMFGYEILKTVNRITEDMPEAEYFDLLAASLEGLNNPELRLDYLDFWLKLRLLQLGGNELNLAQDTDGVDLQENSNYLFNIEKMALTPHSQGDLSARHIKLLKLTRQLNSPLHLLKVDGAGPAINDLARLMDVVAREYLR